MEILKDDYYFKTNLSITYIELPDERQQIERIDSVEDLLRAERHSWNKKSIKLN